MARLSIRVTPRASRDEIAGEREGVILVRLAAPPVDGAANQALVRLLAKRLRLRQDEVRLVTGATARTKIVEVALDEGEARQRLGLG